MWAGGAQWETSGLSGGSEVLSGAQCAIYTHPFITIVVIVNGFEKEGTLVISV